MPNIRFLKTTAVSGAVLFGLGLAAVQQPLDGAQFLGIGARRPKVSRPDKDASLPQKAPAFSSVDQVMRWVIGARYDNIPVEQRRGAYLEAFAEYLAGVEKRHNVAAAALIATADWQIESRLRDFRMAYPKLRGSSTFNSFFDRHPEISRQDPFPALLKDGVRLVQFIALMIEAEYAAQGPTAQAVWCALVPFSPAGILNEADERAFTSEATVEAKIAVLNGAIRKTAASLAKELESGEFGEMTSREGIDRFLNSGQVVVFGSKIAGVEITRSQMIGGFMGDRLGAQLAKSFGANRAFAIAWWMQLLHQFQQWVSDF
jgi:hypothetical protein